MALSDKDRAQLARWAGVPQNDEAAMQVLEACYGRSENWYADAGVENSRDSRTWIIDLAAWFYDNRGRSDAEIPPYIVTSVHGLREE